MRMHRAMFRILTGGGSITLSAAIQAQNTALMQAEMHAHTDDADKMAVSIWRPAEAVPDTLATPGVAVALKGGSWFDPGVVDRQGPGQRRRGLHPRGELGGL